MASCHIPAAFKLDILMNAMLLTPEEIKQQTRELWKLSFHDSEEFMDIYFSEKYQDKSNLTLRSDGRITAAMQLLPYRMTFYGTVVHAGYVSGLCVSETERGQGQAGRLLKEAHRRLFQQGSVLSFLIPGNEELRHFYEQESHGNYWTSTFRKETEITIEHHVDERIEISQPEEWGDELYVFYRRHTLNQNFMLHPSENDFFAALATCDMENGWVLVARRKRRLMGICLAVVEGDGRCFLRSLVAVDAQVKDNFVQYLQQHCGVEKVYARIAVPGSVTGASPYAMARVINVEKLLQSVLVAFPDFELHIGVSGDMDIPENNGFYWVRNGKVTVTDEYPDTIVTPGGLAAMLLGAHPTKLELMLDE